MAHNYKKLLGRIRECGLTHKELAKKIGIAPCTLSAKLNGRGWFDTSEINEICRALDISKLEISSYFFAA